MSGNTWFSSLSWVLITAYPWYNIRQVPKRGIPCPFEAKNRYRCMLKSTEQRNPRALPLVENALCLFLPHKAQYTLLCLTFNCFLSFFSQSAILHSSTLCLLYECRRTGRPPPPSTPHTTPRPQTAVRLQHPKSRWVQSMLRPRSFVRPLRSRQVLVMLVWRGVRCGGWRGLPVRRHS